MLDTYDTAERIQKAESVADGEAILIEALNQFANTSKKVSDRWAVNMLIDDLWPGGIK